MWPTSNSRLGCPHDKCCFFQGSLNDIEVFGLHCNFSQGTVQ
ncbi:hypothetical protein PROFUN_08947 [Planoprotostelium fungivorum]|uniref:Uncharacterized protein n=1 Tax=Planoprotostelium fungivorum TaxID=1890364 RepID=A0A2P6NIR7_9EUKA|nr:hypothetical protein PROFUN_08947 [Planoprotostelium fungivorum]